MVSRYVPAEGDLVWLDFNPQAGHEQAGHRPAIVLSRKAYNRKTGLAVFCPITSKIKGYPFEVPVLGQKIQGAVLADQVKSFDWSVRRAKFIERANADVFEEVVGKLYAIIG
ncbi:MAG: endoribonuclease MazF [Verrucomicrobia bacterium]|nr:endoribonuclease MazF [Verrucomicrobiota bacterium]MDA1069232.1 endoribonuclease MazF [Verrucomicrobiota bacterium]